RRKAPKRGRAARLFLPGPPGGNLSPPMFFLFRTPKKPQPTTLRGTPWGFPNPAPVAPPIAVKPSGGVLVLANDTAVRLVPLKAGLATTKRERIVADGRQTAVVRVRITDAGRQALAKMSK